jgi:uncharacterized membrane protein YqjE
MLSNGHQGPSLSRMLRQTVWTGFGAVYNRGELFILELQEESSRLLNVAIRVAVALFLAMMTILLTTATLIFLTPQKYRLLTAALFILLYLAGAIWAYVSLRVLLKQTPFGETTTQFKKDREMLETFRERP